MTGTVPFTAKDFEGLKKIPAVAFGDFCTKHKIKLDPELEIAPDVSVAQGLAALYQAHAMVPFFNVLAYALPVRESVWLATLAGASLLPQGAEPTPALSAAQAWVYKPTEETREAVKQAIETAGFEDPTVLAADAAFHGIVQGLEDVVHSPPTACPTMVFAILMKAALQHDDGDQTESIWQKLVGYGLDIAAGGTGKNDE